VSKSVVRAVIVLAVVLDLALIVGVIHHVKRTPPASDITATVTKPTATAGVSDNQQTKDTFKPATAASMSLSNDQSLLYAVRGKCNTDDAGKLVISTDGGSSTSAVKTDLAEILAVDVVTRSELHVVGTDASCNIRKITSSDGGDTWSTDTSDALWYPSPTDPETVISPNGPSKTGCTVTSLSQIGNDFARVSCSDGSIRGTGNGGDKWLKLGRLDNVRVANFSTFNAGYALAVYQGCAAREFTTRDGGRSWAPGGCITGEKAQAIASNDTGLVAVVDGGFYASDNSGLKWTQP
jgi:hypothetical protein